MNSQLDGGVKSPSHDHMQEVHASLVRMNDIMEPNYVCASRLAWLHGGCSTSPSMEVARVCPYVVVTQVENEHYSTVSGQFN